jgi:hypothetical protein
MQKCGRWSQWEGRGLSEMEGEVVTGMQVKRLPRWKSLEIPEQQRERVAGHHKINAKLVGRSSRVPSSWAVCRRGGGGIGKQACRQDRRQNDTRPREQDASNPGTPPSSAYSRPKAKPRCCNAHTLFKHSSETIY